MDKLWKEHKTLIILGGIILLMLIGIIIYAYFEGKEDAGAQPPAIVPLPNSGSGIPSGWQPSNLATELKNVLQGVNYSSWYYALLDPRGDARDNTIQQLAELPSDDMFVAVYNYYNEFLHDGGNTLKYDINDEFFVNSSVLASVNSRFTQLSLP